MWLAGDEQPVTQTRIVGHRWSARSFEVRDFLARNSVPYQWHSSEEPEGDSCWRLRAWTSRRSRWW